MTAKKEKMTWEPEQHLSKTMQHALELAEKRMGARAGPIPQQLTICLSDDQHHVLDESRAQKMLGSLCFYPNRNGANRQPDASLREFGKTFSEHMLECSFREGKWQAPRIVPRHALELDAAVSSLHYGLEIFEGLKAYRPRKSSSLDTRDVIRLIRPYDNFRRMYRSAARLALPLFDVHAMVQLLEEYVRVEAAWVPQVDDAEDASPVALYLRPTMISTDARLGVRRPQEALFYIIASPALGSYYHGRDTTGIQLLATDEFCRAWPGGVGDAKCGGNYALSVVAQEIALSEDCQQVLWLDAQMNVTEAGVMNFFLVMDDGEVVTPPLDTGLILPGIMRDSVIRILKGGEIGVKYGDKPYRVVERQLSIGELIEAISSGRAREAFGTGTAATISPVSGVKYKANMYRLPPAKLGLRTLSSELTRTLNRICYGTEPSMASHPWVYEFHGNRKPAAANASDTQFG